MLQRCPEHCLISMVEHELHRTHLASGTHQDVYGIEMVLLHNTCRQHGHAMEAVHSKVKGRLWSQIRPRHCRGHIC